MKTINEWFVEYGVSHRNPTNVLIHKVCVPAIFLSVLGLIWCIPTPWSPSPYLNFATILLIPVLMYYAALSFKFFFGMLLQNAIMIAVIIWIMGNYSQYGWQIFLAIFVVAWIGQFIGHKIEGKKPSFLKDLQFLLIGPLWTMNFFYRAIGVGIDDK